MMVVKYVKRILWNNNPLNNKNGGIRMIRVLKKVKMFLLVVFFLCFSFMISGCLEDLSLNSFVAENGNEFVDSDIGKIQILNVDPTIIQFLKDNISDSLLYVEKNFPAHANGNIQLGNEYLGFCKLNFVSETVNNQVKVRMRWDLKKGKYEVDLEPDGLVFNHPVTLEMFYKLANLEGVNEEKIKLFYYNEKKDIWEVIGGSVDISNKLFECQITHFSRYALAHSE